MKRALAIAVLAACGVRAPAPFDAEGLVRSRGAVEARRDLEIRVLDDPRDVQARIAITVVDEHLGWPSDAILQFEAVERLGGPAGTRWHREDQLRFARLLERRATARFERGANGLPDLRHAQQLGYHVPDDELARAKAALALMQLRHVDEGERAKGRALIAELVTRRPDRVWAGAAPNASPAQHAAFGVWLWEHGAKREAYEQLAQWKTFATASDPRYAATYQHALEWWSPDAAMAALIRTDSPDGVEPPPPAPTTSIDRRARAAAGYAYSRMVQLTDAGLGEPHPPSAETWIAPREQLERIARAYRSDPAVAERMARDLVASTPDRALAHATIGALFDALGDPARARAAWLVASEESNEPAIVAGYAAAAARAGDGDATLVIATSAAAASGDPAAVWIDIAEALLRGERTIANVTPPGQAAAPTTGGVLVAAMTATKTGLDLAGSNTLAALLDLAIETSTLANRPEQAARFTAIRARLPAAVEPDARDLTSASAIAAAWVATRDHRNAIALRIALLHAIDRDDPRREVLSDELVGLAEARSSDRALSAVLALP